jgi:hypothetical protein
MDHLIEVGTLSSTEIECLEEDRRTTLSDALNRIKNFWTCSLEIEHFETFNNTVENVLMFPGLRKGSDMWNFIASGDTYSELHFKYPSHALQHMNHLVVLVGESKSEYTLQSISEVVFCRDSTDPARLPNTTWSDDTNLLIGGCEYILQSTHIMEYIKDRVDDVRKFKKKRVSFATNLTTSTRFYPRIKTSTRVGHSVTWGYVTQQSC